MKKIISVFVLVLFVNLGLNSQNKEKKGSLKKQVERTLKRMTTKLDLSKDQQKNIKPLLLNQFKDRRQMIEKRKEMQSSGARPSKEERQLLKANRLEKEKELLAKMKNILTAEQYAKFLKMNKKEKQNQKQKQKQKQRRQ
ncbi:hypothetical protein [uncultured Polaribacter sp.]|uniref:hypothetical protein n=1 Tax=uncultured Polaribacter sp. TaxID=174711 RepID=UPI002601FD45|nr:hypothetical protein [uncultured Polaribacter sp.]